jgi:nitrogen fixation protein NifX
MKVAFATQDCTRVDAHFGWARHLVLYDVQPEGYRYLRTISFPDRLVEDGDGGKLPRKLAVVRDCALVFAAAIGETPAALLVRGDCRPILRYRDQPIITALEDLQSALRRHPSGWLRNKLLHDRKNFDE